MLEQCRRVYNEGGGEVMVGISFLGLASGAAALLKAAVVVVGVFEGSNSLNDGGALPQHEAQMILQAKEARGFTGKFASSMPIIVTPDNRTVLLVGLGKESDPISDRKAMELGAAIYARLEEIKAEKALVIAPQGMEPRLAYGAMLSSYRFDKYFNRKKDNHTAKVKEIALTVAGNVATVEHDFELLKKEGQSVFFARSLVSEPANVLYPAEYARRIRDELTPLGVKVETLNEEQMKALGMNALTGIGAASNNEARLVVMQWNGNPKSKNTLAFVGKGVTFDSGGLNLKPYPHMEGMKADMAGSAAVVGLVRSLAARNARVNVVGVVGLIENAVGGDAQRPDDIVTSMSGQTIEIINTDAEGRLVLADALWYAQKRFTPMLIVDIATLSGTTMRFLDGEYAGLFSNDDTLANQLVAAGEAVNEKVWRMPMGDVFDRKIDSHIADVKNLGSGYGMAITGAQFLARFVDNIPWAHIDMAGLEVDKTKVIGSGYGVMLLHKFVQEYYEEAATSDKGRK